MIIAIDGPSASGKGTIARKLAAHFRLPYLDTGTLYRGVTLALLRAGHAPENKDAAIAIARGFSKGIGPALLADPELRSERVSIAAAPVSAIPEVRAHLLDLQRQFAGQPGGAVLDGRDIASVIAPQAEVKIYITATPEKRAERRWKELQSLGQSVTYEAILKDMLARDARDATRSVAPAMKTAEAVLIDTTNLSIFETFASALQIVKEKTGKS
ncbi:MAG: (d)CMP kinase [Proteobacteria bacterium]|nr:(d)CMP kinase [Pseudomonadota bacterium]